MTGEELNRLWADPPGLRGQLTGVQNDKIGARLLLTGFFFLLLGGSFDSVMMRLQLAVPENDLFGVELYNELFTNHRSEEHTSELQSRQYLVCRLLLEKKK